MPSKKRKYNARFPAGRIKKIMQTDEEVGKVAQAVPIIISRTLELFVESLLGKAMQVTLMRNAKTLSPSHVKQCILGEARFDFLRDLVKNIPDVSAAEEKELMSAESSPNSSRCPDSSVPPRKVTREDSNSSSSCDVIRVPQVPPLIGSSREHLKRALSLDDIPKPRVEPVAPSTSIQIDPAALLNIPTIVAPQVPLPQDPLTPNITEPSETAIDLSKKESRPPPNFYQETLIENAPHSSVIKINPVYSPSLPSTSYTSLSNVEPVRKVDIPPLHPFDRHNSIPLAPEVPVSPIINIDFSKNIKKPEIMVLDAAARAAHLESLPKTETKTKVSRRNSKSKMEAKKEAKPPKPIPVNIDRLNKGNLQIDEDYDT